MSTKAPTPMAEDNDMSIVNSTYVTDALAPTYNATVVGGGAVRIPVFYDGVSWKAH